MISFTGTFSTFSLYIVRNNYFKKLIWRAVSECLSSHSQLFRRSLKHSYSESVKLSQENLCAYMPKLGLCEVAVREKVDWTSKVLQTFYQ